MKPLKSLILSEICVSVQYFGELSGGQLRSSRLGTSVLSGGNIVFVGESHSLTKIQGIYCSNECTSAGFSMESEVFKPRVSHQII